MGPQDRVRGDRLPEAGQETEIGAELVPGFVVRETFLGGDEALVAADLGPEFWKQFNAGPDQQIWYYNAVAEVLTRRRPGPAADELRRTVDRLCDLARAHLA